MTAEVGWIRRMEELAEAVSAYLAQHPQAMDSLEGIAEWWLPRSSGHVDLNALARTLDVMVEHGILEKVGTGRVSYRLKRQVP
ncbi:MAG TPA: hypothetical protein VKM93_03200 [Terriglobia bacterium]|nr:hypothetical protein [Terriglobia bacterium]